MSNHTLRWRLGAALLAAPLAATLAACGSSSSTSSDTAASGGHAASSDPVAAKAQASIAELEPRHVTQLTRLAPMPRTDA